MARNEEKQQGRLNRLWLQKEREVGRLKDTHERRPKLSTLNSASVVKKWIPDIKNEIEYYLQQSQLSHYPERKIAEFQLKIEALEREYKSFIAKLRVFDPSCKNKPWSPRGYCKRRAETQDSPSIVKNPCLCQSPDSSSRLSVGESDLATSRTGSCKASATERQGPLGHCETRFQTPFPTNPVSKTPGAVYADQDQPLSFDHTRLALATAAYRRPSDQRGFPQTQSLARLLQVSLPNLNNSPLGQTFSTKKGDTVGSRESNEGAAMGSMTGQKSDCERTEKMPKKSSCPSTTGAGADHVLGLDCYSSSDGEFDT